MRLSSLLVAMAVTLFATTDPTSAATTSDQSHVATTTNQVHQGETTPKRSLRVAQSDDEERTFMLAGLGKTSGKAQKLKSLEKQKPPAVKVPAQWRTWLNGAQERPVIEVVSKDVKTSDIFRLMQVIGDDKDLAAAEEGASWWKDAVLEEFSRQDLVVLALIALCVCRLAVFAVQVAWKLLQLPLQWLNAAESAATSGKNAISEASWRRHLQQLDGHHRVLLRHRNLRLPSAEAPSDAVLQQLHELTKELPQGFTPDMFTSLGNAMHNETVEKPMKQPTDEAVVCA
ncbi:hypothetical protein PHYBOEH_000803 [Phytophthora boehmeriae]|uniref:RxLR effector protein n=1 Tax=Phytophthora boehmeriae TaxID=109152 RepID=A0A8T1WV11_9STRA|nr:hypothetical protein PHYBOEH_000803 [Phytophthora boehmeriae]